MKRKFIIIIPARYKSSRLPGKPLIKILGVPMLVRTYNQCLKVALREQVIVATDDKRILTLCKNNNMNCLKYCLIYGCELNHSTCYWAAYSGNLEALKFCHENNIKWNNLTCELSSEKGHLNCLKYARKYNCPWNRMKCIKSAEENEHHHIVEWINNN